MFEAIHRGKPDQKLLAYQYLQVLPQIARGDSNKMWIIPSELTEALQGHRQRPRRHRARPPGRRRRTTRGSTPARPCTTAFDDTFLEDPAQALAEARDEAARSSAEAEGHSAGVSGRGPAAPPRATQGDGGPVDPPARVDPPAAGGAPPVPPRGRDGPVRTTPRPARS